MKLTITDYCHDETDVKVFYEIGDITGWFRVPPETPIIYIVNQVSRDITTLLGMPDTDS